MDNLTEVARLNNKTRVAATTKEMVAVKAQVVKLRVVKTKEGKAKVLKIKALKVKVPKAKAKGKVIKEMEDKVKETRVMEAKVTVTKAMEEIIMVMEETTVEEGDAVVLLTKLAETVSSRALNNVTTVTLSVETAAAQLAK